MSNIVIKDLSKSYKGINVLNDISLTIKPKEVICIKGKSGIGKSTLLNIIAGLEKPTSGSYYFNKENMSELSLNGLANIRSKSIGYISQFSPMIPKLTAFENICVPLWFNDQSDLNEKKKIERIKYLSEVFEIKKFLRTKINKLSGGQIQRIGVIRALVNKPQLIVADEPTGALDDETAIKILEFFNEVKEKENLSIILATHSSLVAQYCDKVYQLTENGLKEQIKQNK